MKNRKGIALIMAVGILALLAVIATSFALNMRLEYKAAMNYYNSVKARYLADLALEHAIAELKEHVKQSAFDDLTEDWAGSSPSYEDNFDDGSAVSMIADEQRKINVNHGNQNLLENLFTLCGVSSPTILYQAIASDISTNGHYSSFQELKSRLKDTSGLTYPDDFDIIEDYVTANSYAFDFDPTAGVNYRAPVNINTAEMVVLEAVLRDTITLAKVNGLALEIYNRVRGLGSYAVAAPFTSWQEFNDFAYDCAATGGVIDPPIIFAIDLLKAQRNFNPNKAKVSPYTTEFCFNSGGYYTIEATGTVTDASGTIAERKTTALVKIYDIYTETSKDDFMAGTQNKVTWLDSCPIDSGDLFGSASIPSDADTIANSIKLGFWDDFNSDGDRGDYTTEPWIPRSGSRNFQNIDGDSDYELVFTQNNTRCDLLGSGTEWLWGNYALRVYLYEHNTASATKMKHAGWIMLRFSNYTDNPNGNPLQYEAPAGHGYQPGVVHTRPSPDGQLVWETGYGGNDRYAYDTGYGIEFWTASEAVTQLGFANESAAITGRYQYPSAIRIFDRYTNGYPAPFELENEETSTYRTSLTYAETKTFNVKAGYGGNSQQVSVDVTTGGSPVNFTRTLDSGASDYGIIVLYGNNIQAAWDDIRIIPAHGNFTSQSFSPAVVGSVEWGTITGTLTQSTTTGSLQGNVMLQASTSGSFPGDSNGDGVPDGAADSYASLNPGGGETDEKSIGASSSTIYYKAWLTNGDSDMKETPILEDVTITYLPATKIISYTVSQ